MYLRADFHSVVTTHSSHLWYWHNFVFLDNFYSLCCPSHVDNPIGAHDANEVHTQPGLVCINLTYFMTVWASYMILFNLLLLWIHQNMIVLLGSEMSDHLQMLTMVVESKASWVSRQTLNRDKPNKEGYKKIVLMVCFMFSALGHAKCDSLLESPARKTIQLVKSALPFLAVIMSEVQE